MSSADPSYLTTCQHRHHSRFRCILPALLAVLWLAGGMPAAAQDKHMSEYQLKMVSLYKLAKFVQWPGDAFATATSPISIGILGEDPFGSVFDQEIAGRTAQKRPLQLTRFKPGQAYDQCHILFISSSVEKDLPSLLARLRHKPVLTVSDIAEFPKAGGMIGLTIKEEQMRLQVNLQVATQADLRISSHLLKLVDIYKPLEKPSSAPQPPPTSSQED